MFPPRLSSQFSSQCDTARCGSSQVQRDGVAGFELEMTEVEVLFMRGLAANERCVQCE